MRRTPKRKTQQMDEGNTKEEQADAQRRIITRRYMYNHVETQWRRIRRIPKEKATHTDNGKHKETHE
eukprot:14470933-Heterocapsa_arctica.AAC.1